MFTRDPSSLFIPTYIDDTYSWTAHGQRCTSDQANRCRASGVGAQPIDSSHGCSCTRSHSFFVQNPEEQVIGINHGYSVDTRSEDIFDMKQRTERGRSSGDNILTIFQRQNGDKWEACGITTETGEVKSKWTADQSIAGIMVPMKSLLECTDMSLETQSQELRSGRVGETKAPHLHHRDETPARVEL